MIGESLDHVISWFSPSRAARRAHARNTFSKVRERGYDAAKLDRTNERWLTANTSPDMELTQAGRIRSRARDLVRNNAYAKAVLRAIIRNVVGCGLTLQSRIEGQDALNTEIETLFSRWCEVADAAGRLTFSEIQRLAFQEVIEAGECIIHFTRMESDRARPVSLALELIDADRIADDMQSYRSNSSENEIRRGVEVDAMGRPVAYWIYRTHPNDISSARYSHDPVRIPAEECLHLFRVERIGQTRGVSLFAPVVSWLKQLGYYVDNELQASAVASCFTAAITTLGGPADGGLLGPSGSDSTGESGNTFEYLQPGMVARLLPGESIETINPGRPNATADAWINLILRSIAVGAGLSYERMARDYTKTNYSSARASDLEDRKEFVADQEWLVNHLCRPVFERFIEMAILQGRLEAITAADLMEDYEATTKHIWQRPGWEWVDPVKESTASVQAIDANLSTLADELGKKGKDWKDVIEQRAKEKELIASLMPEPEPTEEPQSEESDEEAQVAA